VRLKGAGRPAEGGAVRERVGLHIQQVDGAARGLDGLAHELERAREHQVEVEAGRQLGGDLEQHLHPLALALQLLGAGGHAIFQLLSEAGILHRAGDLAGHGLGQ
jgi:hypothetical protein